MAPGERDAIERFGHRITVPNVSRPDHGVSDHGVMSDDRSRHSRELGADPFGLRSLDVEVLRRKRCAKWAAAPPGGYAAWIADMDFPVAPVIREALRDVIDGDEFGYPDWGGIYALSPAGTLFPQRMLERYGWEPMPDRLHDLANVIQGVRVTIDLLSRPGDGVVLHMPAYHPFLDTMRTMDRRLVPVEPTDEGFDYERLERELEASGAAIWLLCHPHNPLGHVFDEAELRRVAEIAERHDLVVISDEVHADLTLPPARHVPFASLAPEVASRTVTITSTSKAFNLAGMRWAVLHAGADRMEAALAALPGHYLGAPNQMAVTASVAAWTGGQAWLDAVHDVLDENRHALTHLLAEHLPGSRYRPPAATYLAWIDLRDTGLGDDPATVFRERGVELSPGPQFGPQGAGHVRLNIATSPDLLAVTVAAMAG
jgi:cystathionine beta-lyase